MPVTYGERHGAGRQRAGDPRSGVANVGVGALSYAGQFNIMAVADQDACPDLDVFAATAQDELQALAASASVSPDRHEQR